MQQKVPSVIYDSNGFHNDKIITICHSISHWNLTIKDGNFDERRSVYCKDTLIKKDHMIFLCNRGNFTYDGMGFYTSLQLIYLRCTDLLPMLSHEPSGILENEISMMVISSINRCLHHDVMDCDTFDQICSSKYKMV